MAALKNWAIATVSTGYDAAATSIDVATGEGARLSSGHPAWWWNATDYPSPDADPNREIVLISAISTDTLTITRAQEGTSASTKNTAGKTYKLAQGLTAGLFAALTRSAPLALSAAADFDDTQSGQIALLTGTASQSWADRFDGVSDGFIVTVKNYGDGSTAGDKTFTQTGLKDRDGQSLSSFVLERNAEAVFWRKSSTEVWVLTTGADVVQANEQTGTSYTLALTDAGKVVRLANAAAITLTVPAESSVDFPIGTEIALEQAGAGTVTVAPDTGVTLHSLASLTDLQGQWAMASLRKSASDTWTLVGALA